MKNRNFLMTSLGIALFFIINSAAWADVLEPYDGMSLPSNSGYMALYPTLMKYPDYDDENAGEIDIDMRITGTVLKGAWFFPKIADQFSWAGIFSIPYFSLEADGLESQSGIGDPAIGLAFWPYENPEKGIFHAFCLTAYLPYGEYDENYPDTSPGIDAYTVLYTYQMGWYPEKFAFDAMLQYWQFLESDELKVDKRDAVELDMVFSYKTDSSIMLSFHASFWWDTGDLEIDGTEIAETQGYRFSMGPKFSYMASESCMLSLTWLHDVSVKNHVKGDWVYGRIAFMF